jgi:hypothetical protein
VKHEISLRKHHEQIRGDRVSPVCLRERVIWVCILGVRASEQAMESWTSV